MVGHGYYRYRQSRRTYVGDRKQPSKALVCFSSKCRPTNEKSGIEQLGIQITLSRICFKWFVGHLQVVCECGFSTLIGWLCSSHPVFLVDLIIHALGRLYVHLRVFHKSIPRLTQTAPGTCRNRQQYAAEYSEHNQHEEILWLCMWHQMFAGSLFVSMPFHINLA